VHACVRTHAHTNTHTHTSKEHYTASLPGFHTLNWPTECIWQNCRLCDWST